MRYTLKNIDSTSTELRRRMSAEELPHGYCISADFQTAGHGQATNHWESEDGKNLLFSLLLRPSVIPASEQFVITEIVTLAIINALQDYIRQRITIKWPNDIRIDGKKVAGILAEAVIDKDCLQGLVLGFGVNLNSKMEEVTSIDQPATSLNLEIGMEINREIFLKKVIEKFCLRYNRFIEEGFLFIKEDYIRRAEFLNDTVTVKVFDKDITGVVKEITDNGALKIIDKNNKEHVLLIGDIL